LVKETHGLSTAPVAERPDWKTMVFLLVAVHGTQVGTAIEYVTVSAAWKSDDQYMFIVLPSVI